MHTFLAEKRPGGEMSSTSSSISTKNLENYVVKLKNNRNRNSTKKNYYSVWRTFNEFFIKLDRKPPTWEERLILFVGFLVSKQRKSTTIKSYISAIKSVLADDGVMLNEDRFLLGSLTRACRLINDKVRTRLPIQKGILNILIKTCLQHFNQISQPYLGSLHSALLMAGYFGLLRVGELTAGEHPILAKDVHIGENKKKILFVLRTSKTHWTDVSPQFVKIASRKANVMVKPEEQYDTGFCPFKIINNYIERRPQIKDNKEQFFIFSDGSPVKPTHMRNVLKNLLIKGGFNSKLYGTHSLRIGRASDLRKMNLSVETIKNLGRWSSNSVFLYLK